LVCPVRAGFGCVAFCHFVFGFCFQLTGMVSQNDYDKASMNR
jgi:hypothetical protein